MITDERCEKAIRFLAETDEKAAIAKVESQRLEDEVKAIKAAVFTRGEGSVEQRKADAELHQSVKDIRKEYYDQLLAYEHLQNRRRTEERVTELWRTVASNRRHGMV